MSLFTVATLYFLVGVMSLCAFDLVTKRIRTGLGNASDDTQSKLLARGDYITPKQATILFVWAMILLWPIVFIGIAKDKLTRRRSN